MKTMSEMADPSQGSSLVQPLITPSRPLSTTFHTDCSCSAVDFLNIDKVSVFFSVGVDSTLSSSLDAVGQHGKIHHCRSMDLSTLTLEKSQGKSGIRQLFQYSALLLIIQCLQKVFRLLDLFHILLHYSLILKWMKLFFSPHQSTHYPIIVIMGYCV
jgi:hypothetical protein